MAMRMSRPLCLLLGVLVLMPGTLLPGLASAAAQETEQPGEVADDTTVDTTGDAWMDARLPDIGKYGRRHRDAFVDELVRYRDAPRGLVAELLDERDWTPGDAYFACTLAQVTGRPCRLVASRREQSADDNWAGLASALGAAPDSEGFLRIKRSIVHSYERWARPLELDAQLRREFPDHGKPAE